MDSITSGVAREPVAIMKMPLFCSPSTPVNARSSASLAMVDAKGYA
jgi:hypothetical protein